MKLCYDTCFRYFRKKYIIVGLFKYWLSSKMPKSTLGRTESKHFSLSITSYVLRYKIIEYIDRIMKKKAQWKLTTILEPFLQSTPTAGQGTNGVFCDPSKCVFVRSRSPLSLIPSHAEIWGTKSSAWMHYCTSESNATSASVWQLQHQMHTSGPCIRHRKCKATSNYSRIEA